jgi:hypothetical protein
MKTRYPQIAQITQTITAEGASVGCKEYQTGASQAYLYHLCNLRNLARNSFRNSFQEYLWTS